MVAYYTTLNCTFWKHIHSRHYVSLILFYVALPRLHGFPFMSSRLTTCKWTETVLKLHVYRCSTYNLWTTVVHVPCTWLERSSPYICVGTCDFHIFFLRLACSACASLMVLGYQEVSLYVLPFCCQWFTTFLVFVVAICWAHATKLVARILTTSRACPDAGVLRSPPFYTPSLHPCCTPRIQSALFSFLPG